MRRRGIPPHHIENTENDPMRRTFLLVALRTVTMPHLKTKPKK
jgi:hypothetical protein